MGMGEDGRRSGEGCQGETKPDGEDTGEMSKYMPGDAWLAGLPGESLVRQGLADYRAGRCTVAACLIDIGRPRLNSAGLIPPGMMAHLAEPESQLYRLLRAEGGDA